jgi:hypothetical protein
LRPFLASSDIDVIYENVGKAAGAQPLLNDVAAASSLLE